MSLTAITKVFEEIIDSNVSSDIKDKKLASLMSYMEDTYSIPMINNEEWKKNNKEVVSLYREISRSRVF